MKRRRDRKTATAIATLGVVVALGLGAGALAGSAGEFDYVVKHAANGAGQQDSITRKCPQGTRLAGGGVFGAGGHNEQQINSMRPYDEGDADVEPDNGWQATMDNQTGGPLDVKVHAICTRADFTYVVTEQNSVNSGQAATADAACPAGTHVASGGLYAGGGIDQQNLVQSYPIDSMSDSNTKPDDGWRGSSHNVSVGQRSFRIYAICGKGRYIYREKERSTTAGERLKSSARCPAGSHATGGGSDATGSHLSFHLNSSYPTDMKDDGNAPDDAWRIHGDELSGGSRLVTTHVVCKA
jgi:hypothetical protein